MADAYTCRDKFLNKIYHILSNFSSHCTLERALELDKVKLCSAHSHFRLTCSSIFWASRHTSCSMTFGYSKVKGRCRNSDICFTFHGTFLQGCWVTDHDVRGSSYQELNTSTLQLPTGPVTWANARRL